jgi:osmoprotectant transport system ATP-binding protein
MMQPMIELAQVYKSFDTTKALQSIDLKVPQGMTTVLIGPSGCGKSTLLRLVIGLIRPDSGTIYFAGSSIMSDDPLALRRRMGYVIQEGGLFPHLSAGDNVTLMARYLKWDRERIGKRVRELAGLSRLSADSLDRFPSQISGGQRQRVSLMRALMLDPDVLLLDEPLGALDPMIRAELQADLKNVFQALQKTVVLVTHDMGEAAYFGDNIVLLREGQVVQTGTIDALLHAPAEPFVTQFINAQRSPLAT